MAIENGLFIRDFPINTSIHTAFSSQQCLITRRCGRSSATHVKWQSQPTACEDQSRSYKCQTAKPHGWTHTMYEMTIHTTTFKMAIEIVSFPGMNGDFPIYFPYFLANVYLSGYWFNWSLCLGGSPATGDLLGDSTCGLRVADEPSGDAVANPQKCRLRLLGHLGTLRWRTWTWWTCFSNVLRALKRCESTQL